MAASAKEVADPLDWFVPTADPLDAYHDPRASLPWDLVRDGIKIPPPSSFFFQMQSAIFMTGASALTRILMAFHNVEVRNLYVWTVNCC